MASKSFLGGRSTASLPPDKEHQRQIEREIEQTRRREERERQGRERQRRETGRDPEAQKPV